jgi:integrase
MATRSTFNIMFYIARNKEKKNGKCPVMGRITVDGKAVQFSLREDIAAANWSADKGRSTGKDKADKELNLKIEQYRIRISELYNRQIERYGHVTAETLKAAMNTENREPMLLEEFQVMLDEMKAAVGINVAKRTCELNKTVRGNLGKFIRRKYGKEDISVTQMTPDFIQDYDRYCRTVQVVRISTLRTYVSILKKFANRMVRKGLLQSYPFADFSIKKEAGARKWLTKEDLEKILRTPVKGEKLNTARNLFILSAFTGLSFTDMYGLRWSHIVKDDDGRKWIRQKRTKTNVESCVPLLSIPLRILDKYGDKRGDTDGKVFNIPVYNTMRIRLQAVGAAYGLKGLHYHCARHTFATTVCLSNGVPIETLSRTLGHAEISTTQIYGKITNRKINEDMTKLEQRLEGRFLFNPMQASAKPTESWSEIG